MIEYTDVFLKEAQRLQKKYRLLKQDLKQAVTEIIEKNDLGTPLGNNLYKKRMRNSSIPTGKSGGFRIIILQQTPQATIFLTLYAKTELSTLTEQQLEQLLRGECGVA